jgi:putative aldouronate transport system permease protein
MLKATNPFKVFAKNRELFFLALPAVLFLIVFKYIPMYGLVLPFKDFKPTLGFWGSPWVGFDNFKYLFSSADSWIITRNTILFNLVFIISGIVLSVFFALLLNEMSKRSVKFYQTALFIPYLVSWVVASYVFLALLDMDYGLLNVIIKFFKGEPVLWYNEPLPWIRY